MDAPSGNNGTLYFEAELHPHRSLSRKGLLLVLGGMMLGSLYVTTLMYFLGAWPVIGFNGADIALAIFLFWLWLLALALLFGGEVNAMLDGVRDEVSVAVK